MSKVTLSQRGILFLFILSFSFAVPSVVFALVDCTFSPGCPSRVQTMSDGICTDINNCFDTKLVTRTSVARTNCYVDSACSNNVYKAIDLNSGQCIDTASCDTLFACQAAAQGGTCGGGTLDCTFSPGCSSRVQGMVSGTCTGISDCSDKITRTSAARTNCYVDSVCSNNVYNAIDLISNTCMSIGNCDTLWPFKSSAMAQPTACTSFTYSDWSACQANNTQSRTVLSSSPAGCTGTPAASQLTQACTYVPPAAAASGGGGCSIGKRSNRKTSFADAAVLLLPLLIFGGLGAFRRRKK